MSLRPTFRFAPSPNGHLHLGHAYSAILNHDTARRMGGRFLVRIEDIDPARSSDTLIESVLHDLAWLGLAWEQPVRRQSLHMADYRAAADRLADMGLLYLCFATRTEIDAAATRAGAGRDPDGAPIYPGLWRGADRTRIADAMTSGLPFCQRIDIAKALRVIRGPLTYETFEPEERASRAVLAKPERWGDAIIVRKETPTSYHLSVVVDDAMQGVTHVLRGAELEPATDIHRLLQELWSLPVPRYHHHRLVMGDDGRKLSKSLGAMSLRTLKRQGATPIDVRRLLGLAEKWQAG
jgi:glutamyl-Q tRNA(Asp) synthetase